MEGLRGLAFLLVHAFHSMLFGPGAGNGRIAQAWRLAAGQGWIGVDLFFVLSGFLITGVLFRSVGDENWIGRFYLRRALRIVPLYLVVLLGTLFLLPLVFGWTAILASGPRADIAWYLTFTHNWLNLRIQGWSQGESLVGQLWSLGVEEQFYLVWPLAVVLLGRRGLGWFAVAIILAAPAIRFLAIDLLMVGRGFGWDTIYTVTLCRADALAAGALAAILARSGRLPRARSAWALAIAGGVLFLATNWRIRHLGGGTGVLHLKSIEFTWALAMWTGWLLVALRPGTFTRMLSARPLRFVGFYSYTLYLVSYPLCFIAGTYWKRCFGERSGPGQLLFLVSTLGASLLISMASWRVLEKHFLAIAGKAPVFRWRTNA